MFTLHAWKVLQILVQGKASLYIGKQRLNSGNPSLTFTV
jgi:hypothetical protein